MSFIGVQSRDEDGGGIALVHKEWLTPRKCEVFWPPYKHKERYYKSLKNGENADENTWLLYRVSRKFFELDDYDKAIKKLKEAEATSDLQSEVEEEGSSNRPKRRNVTRRLYDNSDYEDDDNSGNKSFLPRPPMIKLNKNVLDNITRTNSPSILADTSINSTPRSTPSSSFAVVEKQSISEDVLRLSTPVSLPLGVETQDSSNAIITLLRQIKEQNQQILNRLYKQDSVATSAHLPATFPVILPLKKEEEVQLLEEFISNHENSHSMTLYVSMLGGKDSTSLTNNILKRCFTNSLAATYSFRGKGAKKAFCNLHLRNVVVGAVTKKHTEVTERDVEEHIKVWLKHSPQRHKVESAKNQKL